MLTVQFLFNLSINQLLSVSALIQMIFYIMSMFAQGNFIFPQKCELNAFKATNCQLVLELL